MGKQTFTYSDTQTMTKQEFEKYTEDGKKFFEIIGDELNSASDEFLRDASTYRREVDFNEMCLALGLAITVLCTAHTNSNQEVTL